MANRMGAIKKMKMLVVGDSYSTNYTVNSWTSLVEKHFNCTAENYARPASSLNYSYIKLTNCLQKRYYDVVIFALTSADRLFHRDIIIHDGFPQYNDGSPVTKDIKQAIKEYYLHLYDPQNADIGNKVFCRAIGQLSLDYPNTKFIFIPAFHDFEKINVGNCVVTSRRLMHYSMLDAEGHAAEVRGEIVEKNNHLTLLQNETLANYVIDFIVNYKFGCVTYKSLDKLEKLE
jgi:hypothetical protein